MKLCLQKYMSWLLISNVVTVTVATPFVAYYPSGCTLNNSAAGVTGTCTCIKDTVTGKIWTTAGNNDDTWTNWCTHTSGATGYDANCPATSNKLDTWNGSSQCGLTGGWHLPTAGSASSASLSGSNPGGDWSDLYTLAISGSASPGSAYASGGDLSVWMNNNGFMNISNSNSCTGNTCPGFYWSSQSYDASNAWGVVMYNGYVGTDYNTYNNGVLLVR